MGDAFVTLLEAPMGGGKTVTSTALIVDDYYANIYAIESRTIPTKTYEVLPYKLDLVRLKANNRLIKIPRDYKPLSTTKIFANYHLYGIDYMYAPMSKVMEFVNTPVMQKSKWVVDEGWLVGESRKGMSPLVVFITEYAQLMRKLEVEMYWLTQHSRFLDWRIRYITKRKILTKYDDKTGYVRLLIQNLVKGTEKTIRYFSPTYWRFYNTKELPPMPEMSIRKAKLYT